MITSAELLQAEAIVHIINFGPQHWLPVSIFINYLCIIWAKNFVHIWNARLT